MSRPIRVLVCGGGIAGNAVALQLLRAGIDTTVVERAPAPRPGGQAVDLRGPSRKVAERMGLMPGIRKRQLDERGMVFIDERGRSRARMPAEMFGGEGFVAEIEIARGELNQVLLDEIAGLPAESGTLDYRYGDWVEDIDQDAETVKVRFASGAVAEFDVVIGADGLNSALREKVFGPREQFVEYLGAYIGFFTIPTPPGTTLETGWVGVYPVPGSTVALRPDPDPATSMAIVTTRIPADPALRGDLEAQQRLIRERLTGYGWVIPDILNAMADAPDFYFDEVARVRMPHWSKGRIVLLGDAACCGSPMTGMGTALAIIGAYLLAGEIAATPNDLTRAFDRYEELLRPLVTEIQKGTETQVRLRHPETRCGVAIMHILIETLTSRPLSPLRALLTRLIGKQAEYPLPDYPTAES
ncbi:FAD-dependent monooxygenase [Nocardia sp. CDC160]|uniref:FAD-dependent monooxygenase n=1 Tax=Nocardia sp. CDC160 TaxID=3112166 RepID=UPI002DB66F58|nr:FAD-dependent monooxygenase [Nocardia sp. CDC160]MEC3916133.1 FAD-dependent monooxygenase [Nocardia sp. CDC160]